MTNFQKELDDIIAANTKEGIVPTLLLHCCCAPCSSYVLSYLSPYFKIAVLYYNPNISPEEEYTKRKNELTRFIGELLVTNPITIIDCDYDSSLYFGAVKGLEHAPEGGQRCRVCFRLRLEKTAAIACEQGFDFFTTTLTISPLKNATVINEIGKSLEEGKTVKWLPSDFKKREGYKQSIALSHTYHLYRQDYCGCIFSKNERKNKTPRTE